MTAQNDRLDTGNVMEEKKLKFLTQKNFIAKKVNLEVPELARAIKNMSMLHKWVHRLVIV